MPLNDLYLAKNVLSSVNLLNHVKDGISCNRNSEGCPFPVKGLKQFYMTF